MSKPIRKRSEVAAEFTWDLTDIFPSDEAWRAEYEALRPYTEAVAAYQGRLGESAETLLAYFRLDDELNVRVGRLRLRQLQGGRGYLERLLSGPARQGAEPVRHALRRGRVRRERAACTQR